MPDTISAEKRSRNCSFVLFCTVPDTASGFIAKTFQENRTLFYPNTDQLLLCMVVIGIGMKDARRMLSGDNDKDAPRFLVEKIQRQCCQRHAWECELKKNPPALLNCFEKIH